MHRARIAMVSRPTPAARLGHVFKDAFLVRLELAESGAILNIEPKQVNAGARACFRVVSALAACLDLVVHYFEAKFRRSATGWW